MTHFMTETIIPLVGAYAFGLIGCKIAEERIVKHVELIALILCATLSHGGGLTRDILYMLVTHRFILPSAFSSWDSWSFAGLAYSTYLVLKLTGHYEVLKQRNVTLALTIVDALAVANYTFIGASRVVFAFGSTCMPAAAVFSGITALGGGLWTLAIYRPNKSAKIKANLVYYSTTLFTGCIAARLVMARYQCVEAASLILSLLCALVAFISNCLEKRTHHSWSLPHGKSQFEFHRDPTVNQPLSFGAFFELTRNPLRGIHLHLMTRLRSGKMRAGYLMIDALA